MAYKPLGSRALNELDEGEMQQIRLLLQGYGGTGKTWSAITFPNPIFLNLDRGLGAHTGNASVTEVRMYDETIIRKFSPNNFGKEAVFQWLLTEGKKLEKDQTLIVDNCTSLQNLFHIWYGKNKVYSKTGAENEFAEWRLKQEFFSQICELFKTMRCHVILICHEVDARVKRGQNAGELSGKLRPLLTGQFGDEIVGHFTDVFRCHNAPKPTDFSKIDALALAKWNMPNAQAFKDMCDSFAGHAIYYWQTQSDDLFDAKASSLVSFPLYMRASFSEFTKYMRK